MTDLNRQEIFEAEERWKDAPEGAVALHLCEGKPNIFLRPDQLRIAKRICARSDRYTIEPRPDPRLAVLARRVEALESLMRVAKCPQCDGSGTVQVGPDDIYQCQWCDELSAILNQDGEES